MQNHQNDIWRVLWNFVIPWAFIGAIGHVFTRMLKRDITFVGAFLTIIISICVCIPIGLFVYYKTDPLTCVVITSITGMFSRDIANWIVYKSSVDKSLTKIFSAIIQWILNKLK